MPDGKAAVLGIGIGAGFLLFASFIASSLISVPKTLGIGSIATFLLVVIVAPILEELFFRFFLLFLFTRELGLNPPIAILAQAAAFSAFHLAVWTSGFYGAASSPLLGAAVFGVLAGGVVLATGNLFAPLVAHVLVNFLAWRGGI